MSTPDDAYTLAAYREDAARTRVYPPTADLLYPAFGLAGEIGELGGKLRSLLHHNHLPFHAPLSDGQQHELLLELGDVLWMASATADDLGVPLEHVARWPSVEGAETLSFARFQRLLEYQAPALRAPLLESYLALADHAGEFTGKLGKLLRDEGVASAGDLSEEQQHLLVTRLRPVLEHVAHVATALQVPLEEVARSNITKLASRARRGVLQGSGDHR